MLNRFSFFSRLLFKCNVGRLPFCFKFNSPHAIFWLVKTIKKQTNGKTIFFKEKENSLFIRLTEVLGKYRPVWEFFFSFESTVLRHFVFWWGFLNWWWSLVSWGQRSWGLKGRGRRREVSSTHTPTEEKKKIIFLFFFRRKPSFHLPSSSRHFEPEIRTFSMGHFELVRCLR